MSESGVTFRPSGQAAGADRAARPRAVPPLAVAPELPLAASPPLGGGAPSVQPRGSESGVTLRIGSNLAALAAEWQAFERSADRTVFQSFEWLATWQRTIGAPRGTMPAIVL